MGSINKVVVSMIVLFMLCANCAGAAGNVQLMQVQVLNHEIFLYVKGITGEAGGVQATIGNLESGDVNVTKLQDMNASICTYIMIDNSVSIPEKSRERIKNLLTELVAARSDNEKFALATFGEENNQVLGYTNDYLQLKDAIEKIEFNDQDTYLTDMVYEVVHGGAVYCQEGDYVRILLISDGVDGDSVGYTEEELKELLSNAHIPIYSLGVYNKTQSNSNQLEKMFALSRMTSGNGCIFDDIQDANSYTEMLAQDRDITVFGVSPQAESLDGSEKTVGLRFTVGEEKFELSVDQVRMAVELAIPTESDPVTEPVAVPVESSDTEGAGTAIPFDVGGFLVAHMAASCCVLGIVLAAIIVAVLKARSSRKSRENVFKPITGIDMDAEKNAKAHKDEKTQMLIRNSDVQDGTPLTQSIWDNPAMSKCIVTLKDTAISARQYQGVLDTVLTIGKAQNSDIVISADPAVSRKHCSVIRRNGLYYLKDEGSSNGTFVNGSRIVEETQIKNGDVIEIGRTRLEFTANM